MKIKLHRQRAVELLQALQVRELDPVIVCRWFAETISTMEDADVLPELEAIKRAFDADTRKHIKEMAVCAGCPKYVIENGGYDLSLLTNEELTQLNYLMTKCNPRATPEAMRNAEYMVNQSKGDKRFNCRD